MTDEHAKPLAGLRIVEGANFPGGAVRRHGTCSARRRGHPRGLAGGRQRPSTMAGRPPRRQPLLGSLNKGKRSVTIDYRRPEGREVFIALVTAPGSGGGIFLDQHGRQAKTEQRGLTRSTL